MSNAWVRLKLEALATDFSVSALNPEAIARTFRLHNTLSSWPSGSCTEHASLPQREAASATHYHIAALTISDEGRF